MRFREEYEWNKYLEKAISDVVDIIEILTEKGIDINSGNSMNETPAQLSFTYLNISVNNTLLLKALSYLFKAGADCNIKNFYGSSLFQLFISSDNIDFVRLGIENGGYFEEGFDISMDQHPNIMEHILTDVSYCTRVIVNKYNIKDLPAVYKKCDIGDTFPSIEIMKIGSDSGIVKEIEKAVIWDIEARGYCNILQISPLSLSLLIVKSIVKQ